jgi:hypothetical protein
MIVVVNILRYSSPPLLLLFSCCFAPTSRRPLSHFHHCHTIKILHQPNVLSLRVSSRQHASRIASESTWREVQVRRIVKIGVEGTVYLSAHLFRCDGKLEVGDRHTSSFGLRNTPCERTRLGRLRVGGRLVRRPKASFDLRPASELVYFMSQVRWNDVRAAPRVLVLGCACSTADSDHQSLTTENVEKQRRRAEAVHSTPSRSPAAPGMSGHADVLECEDSSSG